MADVLVALMAVNSVALLVGMTGSSMVDTKDGSSVDS